MPKKKREFKLPRLTISEAARLLNVDHDAFAFWAFKKLLPMSASELRRWSNEAESEDRDKVRPLPEELLRLYLMEHAHLVTDEPKQQEVLPEARAPEARGDRQPEGPAIPKAARRR
jgi:hypothetical protein